MKPLRHTVFDARPQARRSANFMLFRRVRRQHLQLWVTHDMGEAPTAATSSWPRLDNPLVDQLNLHGNIKTAMDKAAALERQPDLASSTEHRPPTAVVVQALTRPGDTCFIATAISQVCTWAGKRT